MNRNQNDTSSAKKKSLQGHENAISMWDNQGGFLPDDEQGPISRENNQSAQTSK